ncbi:transposase family protein [Synechococcus sp. J7-Johnson]|uniref:transposase family protein n=1 Tax=Synechococcus sp. J7-Johnson TaxID=2823737 RepID=UPI0020CF2E83|nr:transposase family protein [Synechococcus sp. J7-Johnson]MCP9841965.1 transposase family protein [Synechococcus sp. J7-Johnson]
MSKPASPSDLIGFLQSLPEGRKRRGVRYPQWLLLLMAILGILSGCRSARDLERFARRHREAFNTALGLELRGTPTDSTFLYLLERVDLQSMFAMLRQWMLAQIAEQDRELDQLICDGKTLRGSASQPEGSDGDTRFVTQVTLYARDLDVAYCFAEAWRLRPDLLR